MFGKRAPNDASPQVEKAAPPAGNGKSTSGSGMVPATTATGKGPDQAQAHAQRKRKITNSAKENERKIQAIIYERIDAGSASKLPARGAAPTAHGR